MKLSRQFHDRHVRAIEVKTSDYPLFTEYVYDVTDSNIMLPITITDLRDERETLQDDDTGDENKPLIKEIDKLMKLISLHSVKWIIFT